MGTRRFILLSLYFSAFFNVATTLSFNKNK